MDASVTGFKSKKPSLSQIPEDRSLRFETSIGGSVFSGRGLGTGGGGTLERKKMTRTQLVVLSCIAYGNFWVAACVSLQAPFFPMEAEMKGASSTIYGLIFGVYELMIITMSPVFGKMVAKMSPNILVQMGLLVCGSATIAFGSVSCHSRLRLSHLFPQYLRSCARWCPFHIIGLCSPHTGRNWSRVLSDRFVHHYGRRVPGPGAHHIRESHQICRWL